jgi:hypothetical protein
MGFWFGICDLEIARYIDTDFAEYADDRRSTSGYVFLFGGMTVSWLNKKHNCVIKSTMEVEHILCNTSVSNAVWIKYFIEIV